jgi:hypothetical protein
VWGYQAAQCKHDDDCDDAYAESQGKVRNDQIGVWQAVNNSAQSSTRARDVQSFAQTVYTPAAQKVCVGDGTVFSGSAAGQIVRTAVTGSAHAYADAYYTDPMTIYTSSMLCE